MDCVIEMALWLWLPVTDIIFVCMVFAIGCYFSICVHFECDTLILVNYINRTRNVMIGCLYSHVSKILVSKVKLTNKLIRYSIRIQYYTRVVPDRLMDGSQQNFIKFYYN